MCHKHDSKSLYYPAVAIAYLFLLFVLSVDSASGAFASNDEGAVMDTGGMLLFLFFSASQHLVNLIKPCYARQFYI